SPRARDRDMTESRRGRAGPSASSRSRVLRASLRTVLEADPRSGRRPPRRPPLRGILGLVAAMALVIEFGCERAMDAPVPAGSSAPVRDAARRARGEAASTEAADRGTTETAAAAGAKTPAVPEGDGP